MAKNPDQPPVNTPGGEDEPTFETTKERCLAIVRSILEDDPETRFTAVEVEERLTEEERRHAAALAQALAELKNEGLLHEVGGEDEPTYQGIIQHKVSTPELIDDEVTLPSLEEIVLDDPDIDFSQPNEPKKEASAPVAPKEEESISSEASEETTPEKKSSTLENGKKRAYMRAVLGALIIEGKDRIGPMDIARRLKKENLGRAYQPKVAREILDDLVREGTFKKEGKAYVRLQEVEAPNADPFLERFIQEGQQEGMESASKLRERILFLVRRTQELKAIEEDESVSKGERKKAELTRKSLEKELQKYQSEGELLQEVLRDQAAQKEQGVKASIEALEREEKAKEARRKKREKKKQPTPRKISKEEIEQRIKEIDGQIADEGTYEEETKELEALRRDFELDLLRIEKEEAEEANKKAQEARLEEKRKALHAHIEKRAKEGEEALRKETEEDAEVVAEKEKYQAIINHREGRIAFLSSLPNPTLRQEIRLRQIRREKRALEKARDAVGTKKEEVPESTSPEVTPPPAPKPVPTFPDIERVTIPDIDALDPIDFDLPEDQELKGVEEIIAVIEEDKETAKKIWDGILKKASPNFQYNKDILKEEVPTPEDEKKAIKRMLRAFQRLGIVVLRNKGARRYDGYIVDAFAKDIEDHIKENKKKPTIDDIFAKYTARLREKERLRKVSARKAIQEELAREIPKIEGDFDVQRALQNEFFTDFLKRIGYEFTGDVDGPEAEALSYAYETLRRRNELRVWVHTLFSAQLEKELELRALTEEDLFSIDQYLYTLALEAPEELEKMERLKNAYEGSAERLRLLRSLEADPKAVKERVVEKEATRKELEAIGTEEAAREKQAAYEAEIKDIKHLLRVLNQEAEKENFFTRLMNLGRGPSIFDQSSKVQEAFGRVARRYRSAEFDAHSLQNLLEHIEDKKATVDALLHEAPEISARITAAVVDAEKAKADAEALRNVEEAKALAKERIRQVKEKLWEVGSLFTAAKREAVGVFRKEIDTYLNNDEVLSADDKEEVLRTLDELVSHMGEGEDVDKEKESIVARLNEKVQQAMQDYIQKLKLGINMTLAVESIDEYGDGAREMAEEIVEELLGKDGISKSKENALKILRGALRKKDKASSSAA